MNPLVERLAAGLAGRYALESELGRGGMATVFAATDLRYRRRVAIKVLHPELSTEQSAARFHREIEMVARLRHPHIVPLFDSGESDGLLYYVMPRVEGESLRATLQRTGALPADEALRFAQQVADALAYAHALGVVHRDIKPENILVEGQHAVVTDFGIATAASANMEDHLTLTGTSVGTPAYMSPEQVGGARDLDARSDQYALACVVFEMFSGRTPFVAIAGRPVAVQQLVDEPPSLSSVVPNASPVVASALQRALAKDPAQRYSSVPGFITALTAAHAGAGTARASQERRWTRAWRIAIPAALLFMATLMATPALRSRLTESRPPDIGAPPESRPSVAVPPFHLLSGQKEDGYFSDGMTEELIVALSRVGRLRVPSRTSSFAYRSRELTTKALAESLGVANIVEASLQRTGDSLHLIVSLVHAANDSTLWTETFNRHASDVLAVQAQIAQDVASRLLRTLLPDERSALVAHADVSPQAHELYLKGRFHWYRRTAADLRDAIRFYDDALRIDSTYALAFAGKADAYSLLPITGAMSTGEAFPLARDAAERALKLDPALAEAHVSLGIVEHFSNWNWRAAEAQFDSAAVLDPSDSQAPYWRAWSLLAQGRMEDALASIQHARALDPLSLVINARLGSMLIYLGRYAESEAVLRRALEIDAAFPMSRNQLALVLAVEGRTDSAIATLPPRTMVGTLDVGVRGVVYARAGRLEDARAEARVLAQTPGIGDDAVAVIYAALGDHESAMRWLDRALAHHAFSLPFIAVEPGFRSMRSDPAFLRLVAKIGVHVPATPVPR